MTTRRVVISAATAIAVILVLAGTLYSVLSVTQPKASLTTTVTVVLTADPQEQDVFFSPTNFTIDEGQDTTLVIDNVDTTSHQFVIPAFDVSTVAQGGQIERVSFVPDKAGTFGFGVPHEVCIAPFQLSCPIRLAGNMTVLPS